MQWPPVYSDLISIAIQVNYPSKWILISNVFIVRHLGFLCLTTMCSFGLMILCKYLQYIVSSIRPFAPLASRLLLLMGIVLRIISSVKFIILFKCILFVYYVSKRASQYNKINHENSVDSPVASY